MSGWQKLTNINIILTKNRNKNIGFKWHHREKKMDPTDTYRAFHLNTAEHTPTHGTFFYIYKTQRYIYLKNIESMEIFEIICYILSDHGRMKLRNQK